MLAISVAVDGANAMGYIPFVVHATSTDTNDQEAPRPPTKQLVQTLRVKIQALEAKLSELRNSLQPGDELSTSFGSFGLANGVLQDDSPSVPGQFRPMASPIIFVSTISNNRSQLPGALAHPSVPINQPVLSPWALYQAQHPLPARPHAGQPADTTYQFIFNIDPHIPVLEQPENDRLSLLCDWSRHLPSLDGIQLTRLEHDILMNRCFTYSSSWLMNVIPPLFLHDMLRVLSVTEDLQADHYSPLLHCSLMAFAAALSDNPSISQPSTRERFATKAKQLLYEEVNQPSLSMMQSLSLLSEYHYGIGDVDRGYMYLGMSISTVRALGLGTHPGSNNQTPAEAILQWHFWSVYIQDKMLATEATGTCALKCPKHSVQLPVIDQEIDQRPWSSGLPNATVGIQQPNRLTEVFAQTCQLMLIAEPIIQLNSASVLGGSVGEANHVFDIHFKLQSWFDGFPTELHISKESLTSPFPHVIMTNICYWWLVLSFYQHVLIGDLSVPGIAQSMGDIPSFSCERASNEILVLTQLFDRWHGIRFFHRRMIQVLFVTGRFFLGKQKLLALAPPTTQAQSPRASVLKCISTLRTISKTWQCAERYANQLHVSLRAQDQVLFPSTTTLLNLPVLH
ncbi:Fungal specific transcription factor domain [Ceratobasidium sp. AG-Ba]|nr:Fungal specific transcription factor domain [Ceratobasidium sp. AG-Ba]